MKTLSTMKKLCILSIQILIFSNSIISQNVGIGSTTFTPDPSAVLELKSTNQGLLPPRMTTLERDLINQPAEGLIIFNITTKCPNYFIDGNWYEWCGILPAFIGLLDCAEASLTGTLIAGQQATDVSVEINYNNGNGGVYSSQSVLSTGVTGLTAILNGGTLLNGSGSVIYSVIGTPLTTGIANFQISLGGQICVLEIPVEAPFVCGTSSVTFIYQEQSVTYGTIVGQNSTCWLDRNLGATQVATSNWDANGWGHLFQWGRGDDGHQIRNSPTTGTLSSTDQPGHGSFITTSVAPNDWKTPKNDNFWQGVNGINNPCPSGWRIPTVAEWDSERGTWTSGPFNTNLKLPAAGSRQTAGWIHMEGGRWDYWASNSNGDGAYNLHTYSGTSWTGPGRSNGNSVRCIKD